MRRVDESYQPVERERGIGSPAVRTATVLGAVAVALGIVLFLRSRTGNG